MKRVLSIVPYPYLPYFSGGQKLIALFNEYLGTHCTLLVAGTVNNDASLAKHYRFFPVLRAGKLRFFDLAAYRQLRAIVQQQQVDTVIIEHPYLGWMGRLLQRQCGVQLVVHTHNVEYLRFRSIGKAWWPLLKLYEGWTLRLADRVLCISEEDRRHMIDVLGVREEQCLLVPYGIRQEAPPTGKAAAKEQLCLQYGLDAEATLLFFNGLLDYKPNTDALDVILHQIHPLLKQAGLRCQVLIAGKRLPARYSELKSYAAGGIVYAGFVEDIDACTKGADILLNPVLSGGGVKTKMIEALGLNTTVVACSSAAAGVDPVLCGNKLKVVTDGDWQAFAAAVVEAAQEKSDLPTAFYDVHAWQQIARRVSVL
ncbi:MAG TPA: glycosyltransferase family 4 protein [Lacibacter sp.]|nr:glycosyltransferase family 4 protein [Lacibacter sp.]HMO90257.1 glycosyltransferase family 4 protein [Lacibacter sp.]